MGFLLCFILLAQTVVDNVHHAANIYELIWAFANSPLGVVLVTSAIAYIGGKIFMMKPSWQKLYDDHKGIFFDAVRLADKMVPSTDPNSASAKAKMALDYVLKLDHPASDAKVVDIKKALDAAHAIESKKDDAKLDVELDLKKGP